MLGRFCQGKLVKEFQQGFFHLGVRAVGTAVASHDDNVITRHQARFRQAIDGRNATAHLVSGDGIAQFHAHGDAQVVCFHALKGAIFPGIDGEKGVYKGISTLVQGFENVIFFDGFCKNQGVIPLFCDDDLV